MQPFYGSMWRREMQDLIKIFKNWRVILLMVFLLFAVIAIRPVPWNEGVVIRAVTLNSSASDAGMQNPKPNTGPLGFEHIIAVNNLKITSLEDYYRATGSLKPNQTLRIVTDAAAYVLTVAPLYNETVLDEKELRLVEEFDATANQTLQRLVARPKVKSEIVGVQDIGLRVAPASKSNLRKGLDLAGGSRVLLKPEEAVSAQDLESIIDSLTQRLNVYGLSDVIVRDATDLSGAKFILVEVAGVTEEEVRNIIAKQGKFEAKIANETVFIGGKKDITYVCRTADCSGLDPRSPCRGQQGGWGCGFFFSITLSPEAADRQAAITKTLDVVADGSQRYLEHPLDLYLDDKLVDTLQIAAELKGQAATNIQISGSGIGLTQQEAAATTLQNMKRLQTILITGSLPVKLSIVKMDTVSPILGERFMNNMLLVGLAAFSAVAGVISLRYRNIKVAVPILLAILSEVILILGFAALVGWNLDIAAMAGIVITIGTAVDHLVVITDETQRGEIVYDWKRRLKNAMFIIIGAYLTVVAAMLPLWFAGAGLLKGFAFTTIVGISFGVLIARPAYAAVLQILVKA
ncbi:hypothetical protein HY497_00835 [Candidatus Woesearchaeota archaeon]|nr:hypothetical protein [Candidatus Woesearchaeota archaeon]